MKLVLDNIRETKIDVIQTRQLPNIPVVPAFVNKLPDAINNMIFHYVGYKSRLSRMMAHPIKNMSIFKK